MFCFAMDLCGSPEAGRLTLGIQPPTPKSVLPPGMWFQATCLLKKKGRIIECQVREIKCKDHPRIWKTMC